MAGTPQGNPEVPQARAPQARVPQARASDSKHYVEYEEYVDFQLEKTRSIVKRTDILTTVTTLTVAVIAYLFAFVVFDQWIIEGGFGYAARVVLLGLLLSYVTGMLVWRVLFPLLRQVNPLYAARVIERSDPQLKSNLVNFVDVKLSNAESAPMVLKSMQKRAAVELSHIDVEEAVDHRPLLRVAYALLAVVIVAAAYIVWSPKGTLASVMRALLPTAPIEVATETTITEVNPNDDTDVPARTVVTIEADVKGKDANHAQILYTTNDHKYVDQTVEMRRIDENLHRFRGVLNGENGRGLLQSLTYRIVAGDAHTRDYVINVIQPPGARLDEVQYVFPTYMQLEEKTTSGGDIDGWEGAVVTVKATANVPVKSAMIVLSDTEDVHAKGEEITMQVTDGTKLSASWKLEFRPDGTSARFYHVQVKTDKGEVDPDPTQYTLRIRPDQRPDVAMLAPTGDLLMPANGIIPLVIQASDPDFQLRSITLKAERNGEAFADQRLFEDQDLGQSYRGKTDFRLEPLRLTAGDSVLFWIEVKDNKQPTANRANTPRIKVEIGKPVSAAEAQQQLAEEKEKQQDQIASEKGANNPEEMAKKQSREAGEETKPDEGQPKKDRLEPGDEKAFDKKQPQKQRDQDGSADDASQDPGNKADRRPQEPVTEEEALQRLLQKQQKEQQADQKPDDQKQPPADSEKSPDNSAGEKSDRGKGSKEGKKLGNTDTQPDRNQANDKSQSGNEKSDDKALVEDPQGDRDIVKKQPSADKSPADNKQQQDKSQQGADNKQQPKSADEKNQTGDKGAANDKKEGGSAKNGKGDKPGDSSKTDDSKSKPKPKAGDQGKQPGNETGDKPNDSKKNDADKPGNDKGAGDNDKKPGAPADSPKKSDSGKDGSGKDDGKDGAGKDSTDKKDSGKSDTGKDDAGKDDAGKGDADKKDAGKDIPGKDGSGKDDASDKKADQGDAEKGDTGKQDTGKGDDGKKDMKDKDSGSADDKSGADDKPGTDQKKQAQGGAGKKDAAESDPASNSKDQSQAKGSPGKSDKPEGDQQSGDGSKGDKSKKKGDGPAKTGDNPDPSGKEEPAEDDPNAKKKKATGDETDEASGNEEADPDSTKAKNDLKKKEGSQPGAKKTSEGSDPSGKKSDQKRQQQEGTKQGSPDADKADAAPDGKKPTEQPPELDEQPSERNDKKPGGESEKRPGQPPDVGNQPMKGEGRKDGQKSEQPQPGEKGSSAASDEGKKGANKEGAGDKSDEAGNTDPTTDKTGQPGDKKKGPGSTTKPSDGGEGQKKDGPGDEPGKNEPGKSETGKKSSQKASQGKQGDQKGQEGDGGDKPGDNKGQAGGKEAGKKSGGKEGKGGSGESGDKPGDSKGNSSGDSSKPGKPGNSGQQQSGAGIKSAPQEGKPGDGPGEGAEPDAAKPREGSSEGPSTPEDEQANLEAARKATNLVLQRLKSQLERGEIDQEMMDELGWKDKKDVEKFVKFLEKGMGQQQGDDNSPEAEARRMQFEETLRSMNLGNETQRRAGSVGKERAIEQIGAKNAPVPREYEKVWQSYTRSLSKQNDKGEGKGKASDKGKPAKAK